MSSATKSCLEFNVCWLVKKLRDFFVGNFTSQICRESALKKKVTNKILKHNLTNIQLKILLYFFFLWHYRPNRSYTALFWGNKTTHRKTHPPFMTPLKEWSGGYRDHYLHNKQPTQDTNIYAVIAIRTRNSSNIEASELRLRQHSHRDRTFGLITLV